MKLLYLTILLAVAYSERPKIKDHTAKLLVRMTDLPIGTCGGDSVFGLDIMNGTLEKCEMWQEMDEVKQAEYEEYKCTHLRVHAEIKDKKCVCKPNYKGPICNEFALCAPNEGTYKGHCTPNVCQNDGELAVGGKEIECICKVPWDGRYCDRLACWRKSKFGQDYRYVNNGTTSCQCGRHYDQASYPKCDVILSCMNGAELVDGKCICPNHYRGEVCELPSPKPKLAPDYFIYYLYQVLISIRLDKDRHNLEEKK